MGYFEHVKPKTQAQQKISDASPYMSMIERVEQRAYAMLEHEEQQTTHYACVDPSMEISPEDDLFTVSIVLRTTKDRAASVMPMRMDDCEEAKNHD